MPHIYIRVKSMSSNIRVKLRRLPGETTIDRHICDRRNGVRPERSCRWRGPHARRAPVPAWPPSGPLRRSEAGRHGASGLPGAFAFDRRDPQRGDAVLLLAQDLETVTIEGEGLS